MLAVAQAAADRDHGGNLSQFIQRIITKTHEGRLDLNRPDIVLELARTFDPTCLERLKDRLGWPDDEHQEFDQKIMVKRFLDALLSSEKELDPEMSYGLVDLAEYSEFKEWKAGGAARIDAAAIAFAASLNKAGAAKLREIAPELMAAEGPQADYDPRPQKPKELESEKDKSSGKKSRKKKAEDGDDGAAPPVPVPA